MSNASNASPTVLHLKNEVATYPLLKDRRWLLNTLIVLAFILIFGVFWFLILYYGIPGYLLVLVGLISFMIRSGIYKLAFKIADFHLTNTPYLPIPSKIIKFSTELSPRLTLTKEGIVVIYKNPQFAQEYMTGYWYPFKSIESMKRQGSYMSFIIKGDDRPLKLFLNANSESAVSVERIIERWMAHHAAPSSTYRGGTPIQQSMLISLGPLYGFITYWVLLAIVFYLGADPWWFFPSILTASATWGALIFIGFRIYTHPLNLRNLMFGKDQLMLQIKNNLRGHSTLKPLKYTLIESLTHKRMALQITTKHKNAITEYRLGPMFRHTAEKHIEKYEALLLHQTKDEDQATSEK